MGNLKDLKVDTLGEEIFLPEERAYVKAVLMRGMYPCAEENIILRPEGKEHVFSWRSLSCEYNMISYRTDGRIMGVDLERRQIRISDATYFVAFGEPRARLPLFALQIVIWQPFMKLRVLAEWLRQEIIKRSQ